MLGFVDLDGYADPPRVRIEWPCIPTASMVCWQCVGVVWSGEEGSFLPKALVFVDADC